MSVKNGQGGAMFKDVTTIPDGKTQLSFFCLVEDYLYDGKSNQTTMSISSDGTFTLPSSSDRTVWAYIETRKVGTETFIRVCPLINNVNAFKPNDLSYLAARGAFFRKMNFGMCYSWNTESVATVYTTPVYSD